MACKQGAINTSPITVRRADHQVSRLEGHRLAFSCCLGEDGQLPAGVPVLVVQWRTTAAAFQLNGGLPQLRMRFGAHNETLAFMAA